MDSDRMVRKASGLLALFFFLDGEFFWERFNKSIGDNLSNVRRFLQDKSRFGSPKISSRRLPISICGQCGEHGGFQFAHRLQNLIFHGQHHFFFRLHLRFVVT